MSNDDMKLPLDLAGVARYILSSECRSVAILTGAGVSVASGIPDFRSPGGMYDTLRPDLITATEQQRRLMAIDPTYVVERSMFFQNPFPYMEVRRPFILGTREKKWKATIAHRFAELLHLRTNKLTRVYTQNIDGLYYQCEKLPRDKIVDVHGTIGRASCESCGAEVDFNEFCDEVRTKIKDIYSDDDDGGGAPMESTEISCRSCGSAAVKPTTVLFGSSLPPEFFELAENDLPKVDLLIVAGTSLVVSPANSVAYRVPENAVRLVVNMEPVGQDLGIEYGSSKSRPDVFAQGPCEETFLELIDALGWTDDLDSVKDDLPDPSKVMLRELCERKKRAE